MCLQGVDLRQYSKNVEAELLEVENASIQDCILGVLLAVLIGVLPPPSAVSVLC